MSKETVSGTGVADNSSTPPNSNTAGARLLVSRSRKLVASRLNVRMRSKLPFEHLERVDSNVCVALSDVEIDALELLPHHVFQPLFFFGTALLQSAGTVSAGATMLKSTS